jgi:AcrR family transcriptional regulator
MAAPQLSAPLTPQKEEIIVAAQNLLAQYGYDGLSIRDLAQRSGLATATIYHHFRDKEDILLHVLEYDVVAVHKRAMAIALSEEAVLDKLRTLIRSHARMLLEDKLTMMSTIRRIKLMEKALPWFVERILPRLLEPIKLVIEQGVQQGVFRPVDTRLAVFSLLGMLQMHSSMCFVLESEDVADTIVDHIADIFLHGIVQPDS